MDLKGLIFDMDGTLANTLPVCIHAHRVAFEKTLGRTYSDDEIIGMFGPSEEGITARYAPDKYDFCLQAFLDEYDRYHSTCTAPFPGIEEALQRLKDYDVRLAIVTGKGRQSADISLRHLGIRHYFEEVEVGAAEGIIKPHSMKVVLSRWSIAPVNAAYIGDVPADIRSAREAGVTALSAAWAPTADGEALAAARPDALFHTVAPDFMNWVRANSDKRTEG